MRFQLNYEIHETHENQSDCRNNGFVFVSFVCFVVAIALPIAPAGRKIAQEKRRGLAQMEEAGCMSVKIHEIRVQKSFDNPAEVRQTAFELTVKFPLPH
jgi:hypothetical protein